MNEERCCDNDDIPVIPDEFTDYLREKIGSEPTFIVVFGKDGNIIPCTTSQVKARKLDLPQQCIKTNEIRSIDSAAIVSYEGSCKITWQHGGVTYEFEYPC